jgi:outer membrane protein assembly factor BamB
MTRLPGSVAAGILFLILTTAIARSADWPCWRGPTGQGTCAEKDLPLTWNGKTGENILWKVRLPGIEDKAKQDHNQSSPIVWRGRVYLVSCFWPKGTDEGGFPAHHLTCYRLSDGQQLWDVVVPPGPWKLRDLRGGYACATPATDGQRIYVTFGSSLLAAFDMEGKSVWRRELVPFDFDVCLAASPVLYNDSVILQLDGLGKTSRLIAYECKTGEPRWEQKRPMIDFGHSTPVIAAIEGKPQLLVAASNVLQGVDPDNGKLLWWCAAKGDTVSPVVANGLVYIDSGRGGSVGVAVDPTGSGDVTKTNIKWKEDRVPEGFSSPVVAGEWLYRLHNPNHIRCYKADTGAMVFDSRLEGMSPIVSPIVTADGRIYCASAGRSYVLRVGPKLEILATNDLDDLSPASPAVSEGRILLRGKNYLYCIGKKE